LYRSGGGDGRRRARQVTLNPCAWGGGSTALADSTNPRSACRRSAGGHTDRSSSEFRPTVDAAKANKNLRLVIMHRDSNAIADPIAHVILNVTDMAATVAAVKAAGGSMTGDPRPYGNTGIVIGIAVDPAGNRVELIQRAPQ
jgi:predicted enzyme related to lactoylglutathione lyase